MVTSYLQIKKYYFVKNTNVISMHNYIIPLIFVLILIFYDLLNKKSKWDNIKTYSIYIILLTLYLLK